MIVNNRREFLISVAGTAAAAGLFSSRTATAVTRKMKMCLHTGNIGVKANLQQQVDYAAKYGFEAVDPNINELAALSDSAMKQMLDDMTSKNLVFGSLAQSVPVSQSDEKFAEWVKTTLTGWAGTLQRARMPRFCTWLSSSDARLTYLQNFKLHTRRLSEVANVLGDHGIRFGLEYVGPKTGWAARKYPFIHTMETMKELIAEMGKSNVGFLLDSWHWYHAGETPADILTLKATDVVAVHTNDAPKGVDKDSMKDGQREIPLVTGVIDMAGFVNALNQIGFDGPIATEPLGSSVRNLPPEEALAAVADAMKRSMVLIQQG
jgi:sugar phosphate isomerase/epimerase